MSRSTRVLRAAVYFMVRFLGVLEHERQCQLYQAPVLGWDGATGITFAKHPAMKQSSPSSLMNRFLLQPAWAHIYLPSDI